MSFEIPLHRARRYIAHTLRQTHRQVLIRYSVQSTLSLRGIAHYGDPAGYCVPVGKRNKQAKDKQLSFTAIVWSKVKFMTRNALYVIFTLIAVNYNDLQKLIFKKFFKKFELNKTKNDGFSKIKFSVSP